jgi:hypothetical protein
MVSEIKDLQLNDRRPPIGEIVHELPSGDGDPAVERDRDWN